MTFPNMRLNKLKERNVIDNFEIYFLTGTAYGYIDVRVGHILRKFYLMKFRIKLKIKSVLKMQNHGIVTLKFSL